MIVVASSQVTVIGLFLPADLRERMTLMGQVSPVFVGSVSWKCGGGGAAKHAKPSASAAARKAVFLINRLLQAL